MTHGCHCRIRDTACTCCGNVLGYHVSQPCDRCLESKNNGHFWMFYAETTEAMERLDAAANVIYWGSLLNQNSRTARHSGDAEGMEESFGIFAQGTSDPAYDSAASRMMAVYELYCR